MNSTLRLWALHPLMPLWIFPLHASLPTRILKCRIVTLLCRRPCANRVGAATHGAAWQRPVESMSAVEFRGAADVDHACSHLDHARGRDLWIIAINFDRIDTRRTSRQLEDVKRFLRPAARRRFDQPRSSQSRAPSRLDRVCFISPGDFHGNGAAGCGATHLIHPRASTGLRPARAFQLEAPARDRSDSGDKWVFVAADHCRRLECGRHLADIEEKGQRGTPCSNSSSCGGSGSKAAGDMARFIASSAVVMLEFFFEAPVRAVVMVRLQAEPGTCRGCQWCAVTARRSLASRPDQRPRERGPADTRGSADTQLRQTPALRARSRLSA